MTSLPLSESPSASSLSLSPLQMDQVKLPILVTYIQKNKQLIDFRREKITFIYILKKKKESLSHKTIFAEQM